MVTDSLVHFMRNLAGGVSWALAIAALGFASAQHAMFAMRRAEGGREGDMSYLTSFMTAARAPMRRYVVEPEKGDGWRNVVLRGGRAVLTLVDAGLRFAESFIKFPGGLGVTCSSINSTTDSRFE